MVKCKYCGKSYKNNKGVATHIRYSPECQSQWNIEQENLRNSKTYVYCQICGAKLRNISNTHLKSHNLTQQEYKLMFPDAPIFSEGLLELQRDKREATLHERYSEEELRFIKGTKGTITKFERYGFYKSSVDMFVDPFHRELEALEIKKRINNFFNNMTELEREQYFSNRLEKIRKTIDEKWNGIHWTKHKQTQIKMQQSLIRNYGSVHKAFADAARRRLIRRLKDGEKLQYPNPGKCAQELFKILNRILKKFNYNIYYASKNSEYRIQIANNKKECDGVIFRFLDFYIENLNIAIEFDESYHDSQKQSDLDLLRESQIIAVNPTIKILRIKEIDWLTYKKDTIKKCLNFIVSNL